MHTTHCILVNLTAFDNDIENMEKEELEEYALQIALEETEKYRGQAFDYRDDEEPEEIMLGKYTSIEEFREKLEECKNLPFKMASSYIDRIENKILGDIRDKIVEIWNNIDDINDYRLYKTISLVYGIYEFDSQFYSMPDGSSKISKKTLKDVQEHPERYAMVFLDYHF